MTIMRANWFTAPTQKLASVAENVEHVATLGCAGLAEDRTSKIIAGTGAAAVVVGTVVGSKIVVAIGIGAFTMGFVRGFKKSMVELAKENG
jgi:hypothetical protein